MNETLVEFNGKMVKGQIYNPNSRENKLRRIEDEMEKTAGKISRQYESLRYLKYFANILLGKSGVSRQKHRARVDVPESEIARYEILLEYSVPKFVPKDAVLMIQMPGRLVWKPLSRVDFFKIIREAKDEIKRLDREYGRLAKHYNEVKESKEDRKAELLEIKEIKLKELALIEEELKNIE